MSSPKKTQVEIMRKTRFRFSLFLKYGFLLGYLEEEEEEEDGGQCSVGTHQGPGPATYLIYVFLI